MNRGERNEGTVWKSIVNKIENNSKQNRKNNEQNRKKNI